jgi:hypothetical protein
VYCGEWLAGMRHGAGAYHFGPSGGKIVGEWIEDKVVRGTWILPNGNQLETQFEGGQPVGSATWTIASSGNRVSGKYTSIESPDGIPLMKWDFEPVEIPCSAFH